MTWAVRFPALFLILTAIIFPGCAGPTVAPVSDRGVPLRQPESEYREVNVGDTLYSIAWESGRDYREIAQWNDIPPPYTIRLGQRIRLFPPSAPQATKTRTASSNVHTVRRGETLFSIAVRYDVAVSELAAWNNISPPYAIVPGQKIRLISSVHAAKATVKARTPGTNTSAPVKEARVPIAPPKNALSAVGTWGWPTEGGVVPRSNGGPNKGIDISGKRSQAIVSAAPGAVVYQGSGLRGYGQLIIVKHNNEFLSAYAHCDKIVVREGDMVKRGQKIAEMGSTGTDSVKLHFEIRYRGTPVDPLQYLPKK